MAWTGTRLHIDESELLCRTGCGFYGNPAWDGHCSKCYKDRTLAPAPAAPQQPSPTQQPTRKAVFHPTQTLRNKVSRSVSDVSELTSTATSLMSRKFDRFEEKRRQQLDKRTKAVKSMFRKSQAREPSRGGSGSGDHPTRVSQQLSLESHSIGHEFNQYLQKLHKDVEVSIIKHIKVFLEKAQKTFEFQSVEESAEIVLQFYTNMEDIIATHCSTHGLTEDEAQRLMSLTERYITTRLYKTLIAAVNAANEEKDLAIQNRIRSLAWVGSEHLDCGLNETDEEVRDTLDRVITGLIEMNSQRAPSDKLEILESASLMLLGALGASSGPASADDFLPALIYCVLRANPPLLHSNIAYITNFAQQPSLQSGQAGYFFTNLVRGCGSSEGGWGTGLGGGLGGAYITNFAQQPSLQSGQAGYFFTNLQPSLQSGQAGYFFTNLCCAVAYIEKVSGESLGLTEDQFDRYMSGRCLPPTPLDDDSVWLSQALRVMQENMNVLDQVVGGRGGRRRRPDTLHKDIDTLSEQMDTLKDTVCSEVDVVLSRTPLTILPPRSADLDDDMPPNPLLPPPLTPQTAGSTSDATNTTVLETPTDSSSKPPVAGDEESNVDVRRSTQTSAPLSPDIIAAQEGLSFLQQLSDIEPGMTLLPVAESAGGEKEESHSQARVDVNTSDHIGNMDSRILVPKPASNISGILNPTPAKSTTNFPGLSESSMPTKSSHFPGELDPFGPLAGGDKTTTTTTTSSHNPLPPASVTTTTTTTPYSGFTVQGGKIPSIPCDAGQVLPTTTTLTHQQQHQLPPPLVPTAATSVTMGREQHDEPDAIDKVYNVLGDIVQTFDNLL
ncbi:hypothetical protein Pmani_013985 [Petrolisthes manimaculis]|uniref:Rab5 GDP/GTP exchange factor n=1 Tax=Petrolisthes manimaculis TaxID=1843537 RepID=A0AAE1U940_9EUCA|nr:hypothetical protein Pmani_013985 [Petrolisthes manimaculis]